MSSIAMLWWYRFLRVYILFRTPVQGIRWKVWRFVSTLIKSSHLQIPRELLFPLDESKIGHIIASGVVYLKPHTHTQCRNWFQFSIWTKPNSLLLCTAIINCMWHIRNLCFLFLLDSGFWVRCSLFPLYTLNKPKYNRESFFFSVVSICKIEKKKNERQICCSVFHNERKEISNHVRWFMATDIKRNRNNNVKIIKWNLFLLPFFFSYLNEHFC